MKVYATCKQCKEELQFRTATETRVDLAMREGKYRAKTCKACGKNNTFFVNELYWRRQRV